MYYHLLTLPHQYLAHEILQRFTVRIHSGIVEKSQTWARLWYLLRCLDREGSGFIRISLVEISQMLAAGISTTYQWLREGKEAGAFRWWRCRRGELRVALGGLFRVCKHLGLTPDSAKKWTGLAPWGATAEVPVFQILTLAGLRASATVALTQRLQQLSRYAAWRKLPAAARKTYRLPQPEELFDRENKHRLSHDSAQTGSIPCLLHVGPRRVFVSKGFIPFGVSREAIARERSYQCDRTISRHIALIGTPTKQLVQTKAAYGRIQQGIEWQAPSFSPETDIQLSWRWEKGQVWEGEYYLTEPSGRVGGAYTHRVTSERFFTYGGRHWIYRTNLYKPELHLCKMSASRASYKLYYKHEARPCSTGGGGG